MSTSAGKLIKSVGVKPYPRNKPTLYVKMWKKKEGSFSGFSHSMIESMALEHAWTNH